MAVASGTGLGGRRAWVALTFCAISAFGMPGCGGLGLRSRLPNDAQTIETPLFKNMTGTPGLDSEFRRWLSLAINSDGRLKVLDAGADLKLTGEIQQFQSVPVRRDDTNQPVQFKVTLALDMELTDLRSGARLWTTHSLVHLTPPPADHQEGSDDEAFDSLNSSTLKLSQIFWSLNQEGHPHEDPVVVTQRLLKSAAEKVMKKLLTGFYGSTP